MRPNRALTLSLLAALVVVAGLTAAALQAAPPPVANTNQPGKYAVRGPFVQGGIGPIVFNGDLRDLPQLDEPSPPQAFPLRLTPGEMRAGNIRGVLDAEAPFTTLGQMPDPITSFLGLTFQTWGAGWPPDTNGDVGPNHYIQSVNTSMGIWSKTGAFAPVRMTLNNFFPGPGPCNSQNGGDPVVNYDPGADRWIISDFTTSPPYYQCIAVSQTSDPVSGGWYFYGLVTYPNGDFFPDYPKLAVWPDGIYMTDARHRPPARPTTWPRQSIRTSSTSGNSTWTGPPSPAR
jgi:hypothetical protein